MNESYKKLDTAKRDLLDEQIDAVLAKYSAAEPRAGLEERVLANLRPQQESSSRFGWWRWAAVAAIAIFVATLLVWNLAKPKKERVVRQPLTQDQKGQLQVAINTPAKSSQPKPVSLRPVKKQESRRVAVAVSEPKLDQFPSPQPLTPEELALVRYAAQFPEQATLIAKAQDEFEQQLQQMTTNGESKTELLSPDQQER